MNIKLFAALAALQTVLSVATKNPNYLIATGIFFIATVLTEINKSIDTIATPKWIKTIDSYPEGLCALYDSKASNVTVSIGSKDGYDYWISIPCPPISGHIKESGD